MTVTVPTKIEDRYPTRQSTEFALLRRQDPVVYGTGNDGPLPQDRLDAFDRDGYLIADRLLTEEEVAACHEELQRLDADASLRDSDIAFVEPETQEIRSVFDVHRLSEVFARLASDRRLVAWARQILGSDVYVHQSRITRKPGFEGRGFFWHSDFETWHAEDGMPIPRAVSVTISLTDDHPTNGSVMVIPSSHRTFVSCVGDTPDEWSPGLQPVVHGDPRPDRVSLAILAEPNGIAHCCGPAGSALFLDANTMHGASDNITPHPRCSMYIVYNSVENTLTEPFAGCKPRPEYIASRDFTPLR